MNNFTKNSAAKKHLLLLLFSCLSIWGLSQEPNFINYNTTNGLPSNEIYNIIQDSNGYIWLASDRGITRYDGYNFETYDQSNGLTGNTVFWFHPQKNGDIICSTYRNQWFYFNPKDYQFKSCDFNKKLKDYAEYGINDDLYIDESGTLHSSFIHLEGLFSINQEGKVINSPVDKNDVDKDTLFLIHEFHLNEDFHYSSLEKNDSTIISGAKKVVFPILTDSIKYHKTTRVKTALIYSNDKELYVLNENSEMIKKHILSTSIMGLGKYDENHFWVGTKQKGVLIFDLEGKQVNHFLDGESVSYCYTDHENGKWFATISSGVYYAKPNALVHYNFEGDRIKWLTVAKSQTFFASTIYNRVYERKSNEFEEVLVGTERELAIGFYNATIGHDLLFGGTGTIIKGKERLNEVYISSFSKSVHLPLLCASPRSFFFFSGDSLVRVSSQSRVNAIAWAQNGIYLGTNEGVTFYDTLKQSFELFTHPELNVRVNDLKVHNNVLLVGTLGKGLILVDREKLLGIDKTNGLSSNLINQITIENDSVVWLATNNGLNRLSFSENGLNVAVVNSENGLVDNNVNDVLILNDTVWIATTSGLSYLPKSYIDKEWVNHFFLKWKTPLVNNQPKISSKLLNLSSDENNITLAFQSAEFARTTDLHYRYKLKGLEKEWNYTFERQIHYPSIPSGTYELILQASFNGKDWEANELTQNIRIALPFHQTAWFIMLVVITIVAIIYLFFRFRVLTYNREIIRELLRYSVKKIKPQTNHFLIKEQGKDVKLNSEEILYIKSLGNYIEIYTPDKKHTIRHKLKDFKQLVPDRLEYIQVNRSYIVRIDKIQSKNTKELTINDVQIPIGRTYQESISKMEL